MHLLPIKMVLLKTAGQPPPRLRSSTMGSVSLVMTLLNSSVTRTQCLPFLSRFNTLVACRRSAPSPEDEMTCR